MSTRTILLGVAIVAFLITTCSYFLIHTNAAPPPIIAPATLTSAATSTAATDPSHTLAHFEVVTTPTAQELGLGGRASIPHDYGMLFAFADAGTYGFWMKDMQTSIDMIWLADDGSILKVDDSVAPSTYPNSFYPPAPVHYVLETRAGEARTKGWSVGTKITLPAPY